MQFVFFLCLYYQEYGAELRILSSDPLQTECPKIVYLVRSQLSFMKFIASQIKSDEPKGLQREYFLYFVPRRTVACEKVSVVPFMCLNQSDLRVLYYLSVLEFQLLQS